jgi:hypothetical protein
VINKIIIDKQGVKWFATQKGVVSFDGAKWTKYSDNKNLSTVPVADLAFDIASGINKLWLASTVGLSSFEFGPKAISFQNSNTSNSEILADSVTAIGIDVNNVKYLGTPKGLSILKEGKWAKFYGRRNQEILLRYKISSVAPASNGYVYVATKGGGVSRYCDAVSGQTTLNKPWAWLPSDTVYTVVVTQDSCQWYGTLRGVGFHQSPETKNDWITYTRAEGLICDSVFAIAKDLSGDMWFGTYKGVSKLHYGTKDTTIWTNYTTNDGLIANKINTIAADLDGSVWFGTDEGISRYSNNKWTKF